MEFLLASDTTIVSGHDLKAPHSYPTDRTITAETWEESKSIGSSPASR